MSDLATALAAVQSDLPTIRKGETAKVETKGGGSYSYSYADLASISEQVLPLLAEHGLSFIAKPTVTDTGQFVLAYSLLHTSGDREDGSYPLPMNGTPQQVGSAITYARRYVLCAVTGVAPDDDDGHAAEQAARQPAPSLGDELARLDEVIVAAQKAGLQGDFDATRAWAAESVENARAAVKRLTKAMAENGGAA